MLLVVFAGESGFVGRIAPAPKMLAKLAPKEGAGTKDAIVAANVDVAELERVGMSFAV